MTVGYPDYRRVDEEVSSPFVDLALQTTNAFGPAYGPFFVGIFVSTSFFIQCNSGNLQCIINWWSDAAASHHVATKEIDLPVNGIAMFSLPNLGPYMNITMNAIAGSGTHSIRAVPSQLGTPIWFTNGTATLIDTGPVVLGAGASQTFSAINVFEGLVTLSLTSALNSGLAVLSCGITLAVTPTQVGVIENPGLFQANVAIPAGILSLDVVNIAGSSQQLIASVVAKL